MASTPLTLAALATSAVPGLIVHGARVHTSGEEGAYTSVVVTAEAEELIVRIPRTPSAETEQSAELLGLAALTSGARARLPFSVPEARGVTRSGDTRAVVTTFLAGSHVAEDSLDPGAYLLQPIADMLSAIHELPHSIVIQGGLTVRSAQDVRLDTARFVERAGATRLLPQTVQNRWQQLLRQQELWDFAPTAIHGSLTLDRLLVAEDEVTGVLGWGEFSIGDPASDLAWLLASGPEVFDSVVARYGQQRDTGHRGHLRTRAVLYHELEIARWLMHGIDTRDQSVVDDAVAMLDRLVDRLTSIPEPHARSAALGEEELSQLLDEVPRVEDTRSDTAEYEALDEDRVFGADTDFIEPLDAADSGSGEARSGDAEAEDTPADFDPLADPDEAPARSRGPEERSADADADRERE
ncbi:aminoglycoside phosphotransferase [Leucobacter sp. Psy1]|uniref:phosphotransferase n=1 Tax=Leucobacter sp. Psy1 TaxID=2875729 RepID=UPI001CD3E991|nr:phosphotransferase [Leucobacter sp. Psy1]UBH06578.1 aminoglycoside phosphotransferase [Leucobacter sp. Psy1]